MRRRFSQDTPERFWSKVNKAGPNGCWLWQGGHNGHGYGRFWMMSEKRLAYAHRVAYELLKDPIPKGYTLDHLCRTPACVNPAHLDPVVLKTNILRGTSPSAQQANRVTCAKGHPYTAENTRITPAGRRVCRTCHRAQERERYAKR